MPAVFIPLGFFYWRRPAVRSKKIFNTVLGAVLLFVAILALANSPEIFADHYLLIGHTYSALSGEKLFLPHLLMIGWLIKCTWSRLAPPWKHHALIACTINLPLWILFCYPCELHNLSMLYPTFILMLSFYISGVIRR